MADGVLSGNTAPTKLTKDPTELTGLRKAAVLLVALGVDAASKILSHLRDDEVEAVSIEIARTENVSPEVVQAVLGEYREMSMAQEYLTQGGKTFAQEALTGALGKEHAEEIMMRIEAATEISAFHQLQTVDTDQLAGFLQDEHPQTAALILAHINTRKTADILSSLPQTLQSEIVFRLASMEKTSPELVQDVEEVIYEKMNAVFGSELSQTGGEETAAHILNAISRSAERNVLADIQQRDPDLANKIKSLMFVFDDLVHLDDRDMQRLLADVDQSDLALALKAVPEALEEKIMNNLSSRVTEMIAEEVELLGKVRVSDVDEAQSNIMEIARELEEEEEITLVRGANEYIS